MIGWLCAGDEEDEVEEEAVELAEVEGEVAGDDEESEDGVSSPAPQEGDDSEEYVTDDEDQGE